MLKRGHLIGALTTQIRHHSVKQHEAVKTRKEPKTVKQSTGGEQTIGKQRTRRVNEACAPLMERLLQLVWDNVVPPSDGGGLYGNFLLRL